jgi:hypothetical protein
MIVTCIGNAWSCISQVELTNSNALRDHACDEKEEMEQIGSGWLTAWIDAIRMAGGFFDKPATRSI